MPTAADFTIAARALSDALEELTSSRTSIRSIGETGVRGGSLEGLVDRGLDATRANMDGLAERLHYGIELCEYRRSICEDYARRYATWQARLETYESRVRTLGPNIDISRPHKPHPPAAWVER